MVTRYYIHQGDKTTAGGTVTGGSDTISNDGAPVAHEGDEVQCPACNSTGKILCDGPRWPITGMHGRQTALSDDLCLCLCLCHCNPLPKLIASRQTISMTMEDSPGSEAVQTATAHVYGAPAAAASSSSGSSAGASALGAAAPFASTGSAAAAGQSNTLAARGVSEEDEAECHAQYEEDMESCNMGRALFNSPAYFQACSARAFQRYQQCRGY
jgi:uncharacterized Zn-binding protein involved in type VI secretion